MQTFSREELDRFEDFLKSPYHNKKSGVVKLFNEVKKYYPDFIDINMDKENLWKQLYPEKEYNYGVIKNLIHDFTKLSEDFITIKFFQSNKLLFNVELCGALTERKSNELLEKKISYFFKNFNDEFLMNSQIDILDFYFFSKKICDSNIWVSHFRDNHLTTKKTVKSKESVIISEFFINLILSFYSEYILSLMDKKYYGENFAGLVLQNLSSEIINNSFEIIKQQSETGYKIVKGYHLGYLATTNLNNVTYYNEFKDFLRKNSDQIPFHCLKDLDNMFITLFSLYKDGVIDKEAEHFEHHLFRFKKGLVLDKNNQINSMQFVAWILVFLEGQNDRFLEDFINQYSIYLLDEDREASMLFGNALLLFMRKNYADCLEIIKRIKFESFYLKNTLKKFILLIYYEIDDYEMFLTALDALRHFLKYSEWGEKNFREYRAQRTINVYTNIEKLFRLRQNPDLTEAEILEKEINSSSVDFKKWFISKSTELKIHLTGKK